MRFSDAKSLSERLSNQEIFEMLQVAKTGVTDWTKSSKANGMFSRGKFWNMFHCGNFDPQKQHHQIYKLRLIQEFGEFLPDRYQPKRKKSVPDQVFHEDPIF